MGEETSGTPVIWAI